MSLNHPGRTTALAAAGTICLALAGCSNVSAPKEPRMTASDDRAAKQVWERANSEVEASQSIVTGDWLASDTAARECGSDGVQWVLTRFGPGSAVAERGRLFEELTARWEARGWRPEESATTGDHAGAELRYPAASTLDDGFFVEFRTNENGSTLQMQTPCTPGDANQLNREKYAEKHTNTPPDIPGASTPSESATP